MKKPVSIVQITFIFFMIISLNISAEDDRENEQGKESPFSFGASLVSRYIFRGQDFGSSPAIQPYFEYSIKGFSVGAWGSYAFMATPSGIEADLYASYGFDFGLTLNATDYYFPIENLKIKSDSTIISERAGSYFDYQNHHYLEFGLTQEIKNFYFTGYYGAYNMDNAVYIEGGYNFKWLKAFVGAGNKTYSMSGKFNVVNVGITASKSINITKKYAFEISSSLIFNPNREQIHIVFALGL